MLYFNFNCGLIYPCGNFFNKIVAIERKRTFFYIVAAGFCYKTFERTAGIFFNCLAFNNANYVIIPFNWYRRVVYSLFIWISSIYCKLYRVCYSCFYVNKPWDAKLYYLAKYSCTAPHYSFCYYFFLLYNSCFFLLSLCNDNESEKRPKTVYQSAYCLFFFKYNRLGLLLSCRNSYTFSQQEIFWHFH